MKRGKAKEILLVFQKNEITEYHIYARLAKRAAGKNRKVLKKISEDELRHYHMWKTYTGAEVSPDALKIFRYGVLARVLGLTFAVKLLEKGEEKAETVYQKVVSRYRKAVKILADEEKHEAALTAMIEEERLQYIGSMVLGINDALVELTGALAGLTFALQNTKVIGLAGLITGISASLSMSASEYLSQKSEGTGKNPLKASLYTGLVYLGTVVCLVLPYFLLSSYMAALLLTICAGLLIVYLFTFFISVVQDLSFRKLFLEMAVLSLSVAVISFGIGLLARKILNIDI